MYYYIKTDRMQLIDILLKDPLGQTRSLQPVQDITRPKYGEIDLYYKGCKKSNNSIDTQAPSFIILHKEELVDFFAWISSYFQSMNPVSAYHRVYSYDLFEKIAYSRDTTVVSPIVWNALLGLTIGEAYSYSQKVSTNPNQSIITYNDCIKSFPFVLGRCIAESYSEELWHVALEFWAQLCSLGITPETVLHNDQIQIIFSLLKLLISNRTENRIQYSGNYLPLFSSLDRMSNKRDIELIELIMQLVSIGFDSTEAQRLFSLFFGITIDGHEISSLPKEDRYKQVRNLLSMINPRYTISKFQSAYLVNLISPGSFAHADIFTANHYDILPWYGLCAGLSSQSKIKEIFSFLGKKLYRDMTRKEKFFSAPRCDISAQEIISVCSPNSNLLKSLSLSPMSVEVLPNIDIFIAESRLKSSYNNTESSFSVDMDEIYDFLKRISGEATTILRKNKKDGPTPTANYKKGKRK